MLRPKRVDRGAQLGLLRFERLHRLIHLVHAHEQLAGLSVGLLDHPLLIPWLQQKCDGHSITETTLLLGKSRTFEAIAGKHL